MSFLFSAVPVLAVAANTATPAAVFTVYACLGALPHANVGWTYGPLGRIFISPAYHRLAAGLLLWRDTGGITTKFYERTIRSWRKIPLLGAVWIRHTPFEAFRTQALAISLGGAMFTALGIFVLVRSS